MASTLTVAQSVVAENSLAQEAEWQRATGKHAVVERPSAPWCVCVFFFGGGGRSV